MRLPLFALLLALAAPASAQMLPSGTWTGEIVRDGDRHAAEAEIERCATGFKVAVDVEGRTAETETAQWAAGQLQFEVPRLRLPGTLLPRALACDLRMDDDGALGGTCRSGRATYRLRLAPPAGGTFGCDE